MIISCFDVLIFTRGVSAITQRHIYIFTTQLNIYEGAFLWKCLTASFSYFHNKAASPMFDKVLARIWLLFEYLIADWGSAARFFRGVFILTLSNMDGGTFCETVFEKRSVIDAWQGPEYASAFVSLVLGGKFLGYIHIKFSGLIVYINIQT